MSSWAPYAAVFLAAVLLYLPTLRTGFIGYDDTLLIVDNQPFLRDLANAPRAFLQDAWHVPGYSGSAAYYRPVWTLSFMLDAQFGGAAPLPYHVDSVLEHALAACLLLALLSRLGFRRLPAFLIAMLYAAHPALATVVAWVPGRVDSLLTLFVLLAMIFLIDFLRAGGRVRFALHLAAFALAVFTKEMAVFLPVLACLYAYASGRLGRLRPIRGLAAGWIGVVAVWFVLRRAAVHAPQPAAELLGQLARNLVVLVHYVGKTLIPVGLSVAPTPQDTPLWPGLVAVALLAAALALSKRKRPGMVLFGAAWFLVFAVPPLIVPVLVGNEQRLYLPMIGLLILALETDPMKRIGESGVLPGGPGSRKPAWMPRASVAVCLAVICVFAGITFARLPVFGTREAFWEDAVKTSPHSSYAHASLGAFYIGRGRPEDARREYEAAVALNPAEPKVNNNLGVLAGQGGRLAEAARYFEREIAVNPGYVEAYFNLGQTYAQMGQFPQAAAMWERVLRIRPDDQDALKLLAGYYSRTGQDERAAEVLRRLRGGR